MSALRKLFKAPVRHERGYVWDAGNEMVASRVGLKSKVLVARNWGRIKYLLDANALWAAWDAEFERIAGGLEDGEEVARRINEALQAPEGAKEGA
jgi:hypothetical protein